MPLVAANIWKRDKTHIIYPVAHPSKVSLVVVIFSIQLGVKMARGADGALTEMGDLMVKLPLEPQLARALLASLDLGCARPMLTAAALLSVETLFMSEKPPAARSAADDMRIKQKQEILVRSPT